MSQYILFYSKKCKYSINFINILHKINARSYFGFICVDKDIKTGVRTPQTMKFMKQFSITQVPSIIVNDQKYVGKNALLWLRSMINDMGLSGPHALPSRQNKDNSYFTPNRTGDFNDYDGNGTDNGGVKYSDNSTDNFMSIDNSIDQGRINYIPEDGEYHKANNRDNYTIPHQSILPADMAREIDISMLKGASEGNKERSNERSGLKGDSLKKKQRDSEYERIMRARDNEVPQQRRRI